MLISVSQLGQRWALSPLHHTLLVSLHSPTFLFRLVLSLQSHMLGDFQSWLPVSKVAGYSLLGSALVGEHRGQLLPVKY